MASGRSSSTTFASGSSNITAFASGNSSSATFCFVAFPWTRNAPMSV
jgi:hypothetical protein